MDDNCSWSTKDPDLYRKSDDLLIKEVSDTGTFTGYASVFGKRDLQDEIVESGAFSRTVRKHDGRFVALWQHDRSEPIGTIEAEEDDRGLKIKGQLALGVQRAKDAFELLKAKVITGLSIGFRVVKDEVDRGTGIRKLKEIDLWEVSVVTFPANPWSRVRHVKQIVPYQDLEFASVSGWDQERAIERVKGWTDCDGAPSEEYKRAFVWCDPENGESFSGYALPIADVVDDELKAIPAAVFAAAALVMDNDGTIPQKDVASVRNHLARYYRKLKRTPPWEAQESTADLVRHVLDVAPYLEAEALKDLRAALLEKAPNPTADNAAFEWLSAWRGPDPADAIGLDSWKKK